MNSRLRALCVCSAVSAVKRSAAHTSFSKMCNDSGYRLQTTDYRLASPLLCLRRPLLQSITVKSHRRTQLVEITKDVQGIVTALGIRGGTCFLYVPHTTAAILINENADPDVASDSEGSFDRLVPASGPYRHAEGNSDSHVKTMLTGTTQFVFVEESKLLLGRWQGIFLAEFDGPRTRKIYVKVLPDRV
jgi:secondary thiamine-phosphate synthase enzyme